MHQLLAFDAATGQLAASDTPPERIVQRVHTVLPAEAVEWGRERGLDHGYWILEVGEWRPALSPAEGLETSDESSNFQLIITSPHEGSVYRLDPALPKGDQRIEIAARLSEEIIVAELTFYVDGEPLANFAAPPYRALWPLAPGEHTIAAIGYDPAGNRLESQPVPITVK